MSNLPRVLVVTTVPFGGASSSSFTLSSLFKEWPRDRLAQVYTASAVPDFEVCSRFWRFPTLGLRHPGFEVCEVPTAVKTPAGRRMGGNRCAGMKRTLAFFHDWIPPQTETPAFQAWLADINPDVVYSWLGSNRQMALVRRICAARGIPAVPHFMDDWLSSNLTQPLLGSVQAMTFRRSMGRLIRHCPEGVGISAAMAKEYATRLGIPMSYAANGVEDEILAQLRGGLGARETPDGEFRFSVIGRLEYGRIKLLADFIKGIKGLAAPGRQLVLAIYSDSPVLESLLRNNQVKVEYLPGPANSDLSSLQARTDCLLYVDDFSAFARRYFRLSFSGKIPVCLALGRPIITIGPDDLNSVTYLRDCQVGPVVTTRDAQAFGEAAREVVAWGPEKRVEVGMRAWSCAQREHRAEGQRVRLREVLCRHGRR